MNNKDEELWADRMFDQGLATERHRQFIRSLGHPPVRIERRVEGELVTEGELPVNAEPEIEETGWEPIDPDQLPRGAKSFRSAASRAHYRLAQFRRHGARRGAGDKLKKVPEGDFVVIAGVRGKERFTAMWSEADGKWGFEQCLDYTDEGRTIPMIKGITQLKKDRLT